MFSVEKTWRRPWWLSALRQTASFGSRGEHHGHDNDDDGDGHDDADDDHDDDKDNVDNDSDKHGDNNLSKRYKTGNVPPGEYQFEDLSSYPNTPSSSSSSANAKTRTLSRVKSPETGAIYVSIS